MQSLCCLVLPGATLLGYLVKKLGEIALIISREAVIEDYIVALMPAESYKTGRRFGLLA